MRVCKKEEKKKKKKRKKKIEHKPFFHVKYKT